MARRTARRMSGSPSSSTNSLLRPRRVEAPAASTIPAIGPDRSDGMDGLRFFTQVPRVAPRAEGQHLGHDGDRDLLGGVPGAVGPDGTEHLRRGDADLSEDFLATRPRPEQADVAGAGLCECAHPLALSRTRR